MIKFGQLTRLLLFIMTLMLGQSVVIAAAQTYNATGTVTAVDKAGGKVTIDHKRIESLGWPEMTMAFSVEDPGILKIIQPGDHVHFSLAESNGEYVIQELHR